MAERVVETRAELPFTGDQVALFRAQPGPIGARARNPTMPGCIADRRSELCASIARHFEFETTFSAAALAAPAFVGLSRFAGSRWQVTFAGREFAVGELLIAEDGPPTAPQDAILIAFSREGDFAIAHEFSHLAPGDRALVVVSLERFREGKDTLASAAQHFLQGA